MAKLQVFRRALLSSVLTSPVLALMISLGFDGSKKNVFIIISFVLVSALTFSVCCVFAYPVAKWEVRLFQRSSYNKGAITWGVHSIIYYPVSLYLIKILYSYKDKITTDSTFGLLFFHSIMSGFVLFILSLFLEGLEK